MNRLGMMVDLSHVSHQTMEDAFRVSRAPVIFSHSSAFHLCAHNRNVRDDMLLKTVRPHASSAGLKSLILCVPTYESYCAKAISAHEKRVCEQT